MTSTTKMRSAFPHRAIMLALMLGGFATPAAAQMYPGEGVRTGPAAGGRVLLYPGGQYERVVPPLLQPGEPYPGLAAPPIHLHMPRRHAHVARQAPQAAPSLAESQPEETPFEAAAPAPEPVHARPARRQAAKAEPAAEPAPSSESSTAAALPFSFGDGAPPAPRTAARPGAVALAAPPPAITPATGGAKQAAILFAEESSLLSDANNDRLKELASSLNAALVSGADRVELVGYGGERGEKSSDARRLSLKRALAIRAALIADGLPADRIDVRALGGVEDDGPANRVDIFVKG